MLKEFRDFIVRGNVIDLAIAVIIGAAFGKIVTSLVGGIIMPPIGLLLGNVDFANLFIDLSGKHPVSLAEAQLRGLPVIAYGTFLNDIVSFVIIAFVIFLIVKAVNRNKRQETEELTKNCPYCLSSIPIEATRCSGCTSELKTV
ncbi:MAG TPA: large conductance mechanosensitive channel protein MscL [Blastocatellia bacterium]|jgi:large conductance mechanosensitive channel|nr:large conductance mechanosensitive channel protein MscL [Blastocatellia bacterium]HAF24212.1 large conductance mechanosensitive channel protein MscL [Blastocatellia bacterium]HCX28988.1 large conductance mechanosensitive channel protein MscL [Blastocatellia bacterium]